MLQKLKSHPGGHGFCVVANALTVAEYAGTSYLLGYAQNRFPGRMQVRGVPADLITGVTAKAASLACTVFGFGKVLRPHLDVIGNAGIGAYFHTMGGGHGFKGSGRVRAVLSAGDAAKLQAAVPSATILGVDQKAPRGDFLSADDLARFAR